MPTVLRRGLYRLYFFSHEPNEPPHMHVDREALREVRVAAGGAGTECGLQPEGSRGDSAHRARGTIDFNGGVAWVFWHRARMSA